MRLNCVILLISLPNYSCRFGCGNTFLFLYLYRRRSMIFFHVLQNIGMTIGMLPITGIPLLFISYGGSAMLGSLMAIGLVLSARYNAPKAMDL
ncbi:FtsW/RodA/SpoVE family cell cycle protein [Paenilisteria weihenstephanensis]|uniref:FtsW/RodA/SpoVE family cell cycle protein n=1 Tax=Listeria weihenstephanensis TaxID=1006155 RepID=UPI002D21BD7D|nr:FtsW/RodA/SpoVE family cell cycle protein [Listeria weihenstephanensis]